MHRLIGIGAGPVFIEPRIGQQVDHSFFFEMITGVAQAYAITSASGLF